MSIRTSLHNLSSLTSTCGESSSSHVSPYSCCLSPQLCELQEDRSHILATRQILSEPPHRTHWSQTALKMLVDWLCHTFTEVHLRLGCLRGSWFLDSSFYPVFICKRVHLPLFQFLRCVDVLLFC